jgi:hypothetical protein
MCFAVSSLSRPDVHSPLGCADEETARALDATPLPVDPVALLAIHALFAR